MNEKNSNKQDRPPDVTLVNYEELCGKHLQALFELLEEHHTLLSIYRNIKHWNKMIGKTTEKVKL